MKKTFLRACMLGLIVIALAGCGNEGVVTADHNDVPEPVDNVPVSEEPVKEVPVVESTVTKKPEVMDVVTDLDYEKIRPDESGEIMIIMYHNLSEKNMTYSRTIDSFKSDLQRLYDMGFSAVSMRDYINGKFDVEAGRTPVVLTFDDGHRTNFNYLETDDGLLIDPDCVVGILDAFYVENPLFGKAAVFYLNAGNPFGQPKYIEQKLLYLHEQGYEIGNHAYNHEDLSEMDADGIQKALGKNVQHFNKLNSDLVMESLALPYGKGPQNEALKIYALNGRYEGFEYNNQTVLRVGWKPYLPVYHMDFSQSGVHRVQSGDADMQLSWWLDEYEKNPQRKFISDGLENRISIPSVHLDRINLDAISDKELFEYTLEDL
ncbi:MAG: polysaccharide deacetylase family protein [Clostridia bacterium]|nr:polysaccharide deacetylase family protein [Clostridia bacterium]